MKKTTPQHLTSFVKFIFTIALALTLSPTQAQTVMYGDTIFWENFGTGTTRADISGRGTVGGLYLYEGPVKYVIALDSTIIETFVGANGYDWIQETPRFREVPITSSSAAYAAKPSAATPPYFNGYWEITDWGDWTFNTRTTGTTTNTFAARDNVTDNYPCSWIKIDGVWKFGYIYASYEDTGYTGIVPEDGFYALINDGDNFTGDDNYLQNHWLDHSGWSDLSTSPFNPASPGGATHSGNGRYMFVNCSQSSTVTGAVYKRLVTELCRDAMFEFSIWVASIHGSKNNAQFRIEIWSADPGEDPSLGGLDADYVGLEVEDANGATLLALGDKTNGILGQWLQIKKHFTLVGQDYCWVVVRNYGAGGGNDIAIDDLVFKPYAPFNLEIALSTEVLSGAEMACNEGLVSLVSNFPHDSIMPDYINIEEFGFYFQGYDSINGTWENIGNAIPIQTQSASEPLELTIPLAEYNLYSHYRVTVATTPAGFGGRCITFTYPPESKVEIGDAPEFRLSGQDVCGTSGVDPGTFYIVNTNQADCDNNWQVKVRINGGEIQTLSPTQLDSNPCP